MNKQRERLVELLDEAEIKFGCFNAFCTESATGEAKRNLLDFLLANGVIVPPVKVGDKVYVVDYTRLGDMIFKCTIEEISHFTYGTYYYLNWGLHIPRFKAFQESSFGKTVFLTREEAEAKLKGGVQG